jgi:hypothetical protein
LDRNLKEKTLKEECFDACIDAWKSATPNGKYWKGLALTWGYGEDGAEKLRSEFKRLRKKRGIFKEEKEKQEIPNVNIFVYDLECSFMEVGVFELFDQNVGVDQILSQSIIICWGGKFLNDEKPIFACLTSEEALAKDDERIVRELHKLLSKADIWIGHNLVNFDNKKIATRFLHYGLPPIRKPSIDTYLIAKRYFDFPSNSLKGINKYLNIKQKGTNEGFSLWKRCMEGEESALKDMLNYCLIDVICTSQLYYKVRGFVKNPPNLAWFFESNEKRCANCGGTELKETGSFVYLSGGKYPEIRCSECGAIMRTKENLFEKNKRKNLLLG